MKWKYVRSCLFAGASAMAFATFGEAVPVCAETMFYAESSGGDQTITEEEKQFVSALMGSDEEPEGDNQETSNSDEKEPYEKESEENQNEKEKETKPEEKGASLTITPTETDLESTEMSDFILNYSDGKETKADAMSIKINLDKGMEVSRIQTGTWTNLKDTGVLKITCEKDGSPVEIEAHPNETKEIEPGVKEVTITAEEIEKTGSVSNLTITGKILKDELGRSTSVKSRVSADGAVVSEAEEDLDGISYTVLAPSLRAKKESLHKDEETDITVSGIGGNGESVPKAYTYTMTLPSALKVTEIAVPTFEKAGCEIYLDGTLFNGTLPESIHAVELRITPEEAVFLQRTPLVLHVKNTENKTTVQTINSTARANVGAVSFFNTGFLRMDLEEGDVPPDPVKPDDPKEHPDEPGKDPDKENPEKEPEEEPEKKPDDGDSTKFNPGEDEPGRDPGHNEPQPERPSVPDRPSVTPIVPVRPVTPVIPEEPKEEEKPEEEKPKDPNDPFQTEEEAEKTGGTVSITDVINAVAEPAKAVVKKTSDAMTEALRSVTGQNTTEKVEDAGIGTTIVEAAEIPESDSTSSSASSSESSGSSVTEKEPLTQAEAAEAANTEAEKEDVKGRFSKFLGILIGVLAAGAAAVTGVMVYGRKKQKETDNGKKRSGKKNS